VICGHSHCGAMEGLLHPEGLEGLPAMRRWLSHAEATQRIVLENYRDRGEEERLNVTTQENVLVQIENLRSHPAVAARLASGRLHIHGWVYQIASGEVFAYDTEEGQFGPLREAKPAVSPPAMPAE
jgi:carbonic anhydrase